MQQHPVPQPITSYQFRLVGDMTLRQFGQLAGGALIAFLIYSTPIPFFLKWPGILFFGFLGFAFAFVPLEERPLDKWFVAYLKAIYSPTLFTWKPTHRIPEYFKTTPLPPLTIEDNRPIKTSTEKLDSYLQSLGRKRGQTKNDERELLDLERIEALFATAKLPSSIKVDAKLIEDSLESLRPQLKIQPRKLVVPPATSVIMRTSPLSQAPAKPKSSLFAKPETTSVVETKPAPTMLTNLPPKAVTLKTFTTAKTADDLPIPAIPTQPNVVVGMVLNSEGKIIDNAIIEIRDKEGLPVRALRSNKLGQFRIVTPLPNGIYEMEVEKEGLAFDIINIDISGEVVRPIEIRAKR